MELTEIFGDTKQVKILDYLLNSSTKEFSKADIARATNSNWGTANSKINKNPHIQSMLMQTRTFGRGAYYTVDKTNKLYKILKHLKKNPGGGA